MKFKIAWVYADDPDEARGRYWEEHEEHIEDAQAWAEKTIAWFNDTLLPGERARKLVAVEILGDEANERLHQWEKNIRGMSASFRGRSCDLMFCNRCGITGKRFGIGGNVKIDSKFRKKAFQRCDTAKQEIAKRGMP